LTLLAQPAKTTLFAGANGADVRKVPYQRRHAGKNHAFCPPRTAPPALIPLKAPQATFSQY
jgi:hypothetical protein